MTMYAKILKCGCGDHVYLIHKKGRRFDYIEVTHKTFVRPAHIYVTNEDINFTDARFAARLCKEMYYVTPDKTCEQYWCDMSNCLSTVDHLQTQETPATVDR